MRAAPARMSGLGRSEIRSTTARCEALGAINLGQGLCRVPPPAELLELAARTIAMRAHSYSAARGTPRFRAAVATKLAHYNERTVDPDSQVVATIGATGAFNAALAGLLSPGEGVLLLEPFYEYHRSAVRLMGLEAQIAPATQDGRLTLPKLLATVTETTRAIVLCTPSNPAGHRLDAVELEIVERVACDLDLIVLTDEIYEHIYFGEEPHLSPASVGRLGERTVSISGLSKTFSIPGWRLGYASGPRELLEQVGRAADVLSVCAPTPLQEIAADFLGVDDSYYADLRESYRAKLDLLTEIFQAHGLPVHQPEGAYYALVDTGPLGAQSAREGSELLLERHGIGTVPLDAFMESPAGQALVRVCFSCPDDDLNQVAERLQAAGA